MVSAVTWAAGNTIPIRAFLAEGFAWMSRSALLHVLDPASPAHVRTRFGQSLTSACQ